MWLKHMCDLRKSVIEALFCTKWDWKNKMMLVLEVKKTEANEQHKSIIGALKAAAPKWEFEEINFVVGTRGSVLESDFYTKLKKLGVQEGEKDKLFADHVTQVFEVHNRVIVSFFQQVQGGAKPTTKGSRENIGHNVHVWADRERNTRS